MRASQQSSSVRRRFPLRHLAEGLLAPAVGVLVLGAWFYSTRAGDIPKFILPTPQGFFKALSMGFTVDLHSRASFIYHASYTLKGALLGFAIGSSAGIIMGSIIAEFPIVERGVFPFFFALQGLPKLALAPLIMVWLGFGGLSGVVVSCLGTYFPLLVNTVSAMGAVDREALDLMRGLKATRWQTFRMVKFPGGLPIIFAGLRMSVVYSLLGALLAEYTGGHRGIGFLMIQQQGVLNTAGIFASLIVLAVMSAVMSAIVRVVEKRVLYWAQAERFAVAG
jgi:NitT/TauT family transport system permease protein